jgi:hypothetical protein
MLVNETSASPQLPGQAESPRCVNCHIPMRHSCTEGLDTGGERRTYECITCVSTQTVEMAAA